MSRLAADLLRRRVRSRGGEPLVTYYDLTTGERTELSGTTFLNWVDKTSNLLVDEYLLDVGAVVDLELARTAPGHWLTLVIELAGWQIGATVTVGTAVAPGLLVLGPDFQSHDLSRADAVLACSLHPLGLGFATPLPAGVADFSLEVRGQADHYVPGPRSGLEVAWVDDHRRLTQADLVAIDTAARSGRRLVIPSDPWASVRDSLIVSLLTSGSAVVVVGDDADRLARIALTERAELDIGAP